MKKEFSVTWLLAWVTGFCCLCAAASAQPNDKLPDAIKQSGVLVLGTSATTDLPYTAIKEGTTDQFIGAEPELAAAIAQKLGLKLEIKNLGFDSLIPSLEANRVNVIMSGMLDTPVRENKIDFVNHIIGGSAMVQKASVSKKITSMDELCGLKASALRGAMESISATKQSEKCVAEGKPAVDIQIFPDNSASLAALTSGRTDVALGGLPRWSALTQKFPDQFVMVGEPFNYGPCGIGIPKNSPLGPLIEQALNELIADGTYASVMKKYGFVKQSYVTQAKINGVASHP